MTSKLSIRNLKMDCIVGMNPDERERKQSVLVNVTMWADLDRASKSDDLKDTINYAALGRSIREFVDGSRFRLIEALASGIADICMADQMVERAKIKVDKLGVPRQAESAGIEILRRR